MRGREVTADTLLPAFAQIVDEIARECARDGEAAVDAGAAAALDYLHENSPERTGGYAAGWRCEREAAGRDGYYVRVHNAAKPGLTHLLENGHEQFVGGRDTGRRTPGRPHIEPAVAAAGEAMERRAAT